MNKKTIKQRRKLKMTNKECNCESLKAEIEALQGNINTLTEAIHILTKDNREKDRRITFWNARCLRMEKGSMGIEDANKKLLKALKDIHTLLNEETEVETEEEATSYSINQILKIDQIVEKIKEENSETWETL